MFPSMPDLRYQPLKDPDVEYFTNKSSFREDGIHLAKYTVVTLDSIIEAKPLLQGTSAQKAELITLTQVFLCAWAKEICVDIYTDSKYAFTTLHVHKKL